jgi:hypothetical protein
VRRVFEDQVVQHLTIPELAALARFYSTPEGQSVARKTPAFTAAARPVLEAAVVAWRKDWARRRRAHPNDPSA